MGGYDLAGKYKYWLSNYYVPGLIFHEEAIGHGFESIGDVFELLPYQTDPFDAAGGGCRKGWVGYLDSNRLPFPKEPCMQKIAKIRVDLGV